MRTFNERAAQGEVNIQIVDAMPKHLKPFEPEGGFYILGHSESGNHHVLDRDHADMFIGGKTGAGMDILYAIVKEPTDVTQLKDGKPHKSIPLNKGDIVRFNPSIDYNPYAKAIERARD